MKHSSVKLNTPCEFLNITPMNPLISKCQIKVCYVGDTPNRNGTVITKETARNMANSLPGSPIVGFYNEATEDFEEHNRVIDISNGKFEIKDTTRPYGFVDLNAKVWFQKFLDDGAVEHEYLMTEGYIWTGAYPESMRILTEGNNQSMELDEKTLDGTWSEKENGSTQFFIINEAIISKLCVLGEDYEPCFEGAGIGELQFSYGDSFKTKMLTMMKELKELLEKGGTNMDEEVKDTVLEPEDETSEKISENSDNSDEVIINNSDNTSEDNNSENEEPIEEPALEVEPEETEPTEDEPAAPAYILEEIPEYVELLNKYNELQNSYNDLMENKNELENQMVPLKEFKLASELKDKKAMIDQFYMLSDEDKKDVLDNINEYSLDDIEAKLSVICVRNKVSFDLDENKETGATTYNLNDSVEDESVPAWVKACLRNKHEN